MNKRENKKYVLVDHLQYFSDSKHTYSDNKNELLKKAIRKRKQGRLILFNKVTGKNTSKYAPALNNEFKKLKVKPLYRQIMKDGVITKRRLK